MNYEMKKQKKSGLQVIFQRNITGFCIIITGILLCIPLIFTLVEMGFFSKEPTVTTKIKAPAGAPILRIVADEGFKPRVYKNEKGECAGADVEVAIEAANRLGMRPEIAFSDWICARNTLNEGNADIILGLEIFSNMEGVLKTIPISNDSLNVYGKTKVKDAASLAGKKVGLMAKSVIISMFELNCEYVEYYTNAEILQALANGEVDYAICHGSIAQNIIKEKNLKLEECFRLMESYPAIGVRDDLPDLRESINQILREMADDGTIQKLENKWINDSANRKSFGNVVKNNSRFYLSFFGILIILEFMLVILAFQSRYYEKSMEYNEKIREQYNLLISMANNYASMHLIHLKENKVSEFSSQYNLKKYVTDNMSAEEQMRKIMTAIIVPEMQESVLEFTDFTTLAERLGENRTISKEFLGKHIGWFRAQFTVVAFDQEGWLSEVVFTTLAIDHEKKREEYLLHISNSDELTGIYNRHAYETDLEELRKERRENLVFLSLDINGLKAVNDTRGHKAGDRMLQQAAIYMEEIFCQYGKVYRIGGDEFAALIHIDYKEMPLLKETFQKYLEEQSKKTGNVISVSLGYASWAEYKNAAIDELERIADEKMYQEKERYHKAMASMSLPATGAIKKSK